MGVAKMDRMLMWRSQPFRVKCSVVGLILMKLSNMNVPAIASLMDENPEGISPFLFSGNALTYADIMLVVLQDNLRSAVIGGGDVIEKFPKMCNLFQRVSCLPNIKAWRGSRPIDPMFNN